MGSFLLFLLLQESRGLDLPSLEEFEVLSSLEVVS
jgi:hypothetical protein